MPPTGSYRHICHSAFSSRGYCQKSESSVRRGEGGGVGKGKKDTGYLYKALMVARRASPCSFHVNLPLQVPVLLLRVGLQKCLDPLHNAFWGIFLQEVAGILKFMRCCMWVQLLPAVQDRC